MAYATETRYHYFSLDSDQDLSAAVLELSTQDPAVWVTAIACPPPASADSFPTVEEGLNRYWWKSLFGPTKDLQLTSVETLVSGHLSNVDEDLYPTWVIFSEDVPEPLVSSAYCWPVDTSCDCDWSEHTPDAQQTAILLAVETLRMLTGYRVGGCPVVARPCREPCASLGTWATYPVTSSVATGSPVRGWQPTLASGAWLNVACGCAGRDCSCTTLDSVPLPGITPTRVTEVKVDGVVVDPSFYWLTNNRLVRLGGPAWPTCQDLSLDDDQPGTFSVAYTPTAAPGALGAVAAGRLAAEYVLLCQGRQCNLPATVRTVTRNGVTLDLAAADGDLWPGGLTGLRDVDVFIRRWNPYALRGPSVVWSPDARRHTTT